MHSDWFNIGLAFLEGFALIVSPCILPILPIILTGSLTGNKSRPIGIILGFIVIFTAVTLFSKILLDLLHISPDLLRDISFSILILLGIMMMSTYLTEKFNLLTQRLTNVGSSMGSANNPESGFWGGVMFGGLVGVIWTPCAGPILAAVIVQVVVQQTNTSSLLTVLSFAIGAGVPMFLIALVGRGVMSKFSFFREKTVLLRKVLGFIIILSVIFSMYSANLTLSYAQSSSAQSPSVKLVDGLESPYPAPEIAGITAWINSAPLQLSDLKGKVVLIDFWTYSCINCLRTLPYLKDWYAKYHDKGLVIIGVHSPEFEFEKDLSNVKNAVTKDGILYPVALDSNFVTWRNFQNQYWPAHYLINKEGQVVYTHFGEGEYDVTENNIQYLLGVSASTTKADNADANYEYAQTPETYLGYARAENYASPEAITKNAPALYSYPQKLAKDQWALKGKWAIYPDKIISASPGASIKLHFDAGKVYAVMGMTGLSIKATLLLNGENLVAGKGTDVINNQVLVDRNQLYSLVDLKQGSEGTLELTATTSGLEVYTFTFGN